MYKDGNVLGSCAKLYNNREEFEQFVKMIEGLKARHRLRDVLIGMEPTGHYWRKLAYFAKEHGYEVRFYNRFLLQIVLLRNISETIVIIFLNPLTLREGAMD